MQINKLNKPIEVSIEVEKVTPYSNQQDKKPQIETMFDNIAHQYDFLNHLLSLGIDILWRKRAIREISAIQPKVILDMASGTGDFAMEALVLNPKRVIGIDLSQKMLDIGIDKAKKRKIDHIVTFEKGDSEKIEYESNFFDAITVGFGVRNFENLEKGLTELCRVLKPGGKIAILEPSFPTNPIMKVLFSFHFRYLTPMVGKFFSRDSSAYEYLPSSVEVFPQGKSFQDLMARCGFVDTKYYSLSFGICALYVGNKPTN